MKFSLHVNTRSLKSIVIIILILVVFVIPYAQQSVSPRNTEKYFHKDMTMWHYMEILGLE